MKRKLITLMALFSCCVFCVTGCSDASTTNSSVYNDKAQTDINGGNFGIDSVSNSADNETADVDSYKENETVEDESSTKDKTDVDTKMKKLVYTYDLSFSAFKEDKKEITDNIDKAVKKVNGFVENSDYSDSYYSLTIKVPTEERDNFVKSITKDVNYDDYTLNKAVENKTAEYNDMEKNYQIAEDNYNAYVRLLNKAEKLDEILEVTKYVNEAKSNMDYYKGLMNGIDEDVLYSTINVSVRFKTVMTSLDKDLPFSKELSTSFKTGINSFVEWLHDLILVIAEHLIPILVIIVVAVIVVRYRKKHPVKEDKRYSYANPINGDRRYSYPNYANPINNANSIQEQKEPTKEVQEIVIDTEKNPK